MEYRPLLIRHGRESTKARSRGDKGLEEVKQKIARIVRAIIDGTDTPTLRQVLLSLEHERAELETNVATSHKPTLVEPPSPRKIAKIFRRKVERLEDTLNTEPNITSTAVPILRALIDGIVLYPRKERGPMTIQVHGEPSALFLLAEADASGLEHRMITVVAEEGLEPPTRGL